jgi:HAMP domain-containing protein/signal transduction histidine kinase/DNA-binding response OmpR family regulator
MEIQSAGSEILDIRQLLSVLTAVKQGDFSARMALDYVGLAGKVADTLNEIIDTNQRMAQELERISTVVGKEGQISQRASLGVASGQWANMVGSVNTLITDMVQPTSETARVIRAVARGDLSQTISLEIEGRSLKGEFLQTAHIVNTMVEQLSSFSSEVTRVAREVGTEGNLGGQATVEGVAGTWKDLTDNVNLMANNLTTQVRNIADVSTAIATGDLTKKITVEAKGEILDLKNTINTMVDQLNSFASEVTRVARDVGTEGNLGGQATVEGVGGTWKDLTDNVNLMANNLTTQVRNIADVSTAIATGDLTKKITVEAKGEILDLKNTLNTMVDQLNSFASEVTRVARDVGTEGILGGQATVAGVGGTWKDLTDNVNLMANNLTSQVRNIADVSTAIANGDLTKKITVEAKGEILDLKNTINTMVDQLNSFAAEVTRVARDVGTEGILGGQATVGGVAGTWKDLTDNVNRMANNLTNQVRNIADVSTAIATGDLTKKITVEAKGEVLDLKNTLNTMVDQLNSFASEVTRVARDVGTEGILGGQATVEGVGGTWKDLTDNVNFMANNLTNQVRNIADVSTAIATGDLTKKITVEAKGEILDLKNTLNTMVDQLNSFAAEVTRVARDVGTEGILGGQATVGGVAGTWKDLTDNVNLMANNLTDQVRGIARVVTAVANGDLKQKLALSARGEIAALADTINEMIDTLATFADQVTTVAREVGMDGKLGGVAVVPSASGTWRHLTDNVNQLAANLTTQVRAIGEVATAVTRGDLTRSITVDTSGELSDLKDNINQMIANLRETTRKNTDQDWLKTNLARFTRMLQGQRDLETVAKEILSELAPLVQSQHGVFFITDEEAKPESSLKLISSYAYKERKGLSQRFRFGEGLVGQCALEKEAILITDVPDDYIRINSGLGEAKPLSVIALPVIFEGQVTAVIELASFYRFSDIHLTFLDQLTESIAIVLNTIGANMRTETLLEESQSLTEALQKQQAELTETNRRLEQQARSLQASEDLLRRQQEELRKTNEELEDKARLLEDQNYEVERKNREIEQAKQDLEEKAEQLALSSKYKNEFLANMSHELRTPLNSMLILSQLLGENADKNLTDKQVEFAQTINSSGADLLALINDILDLAKIESGTMTPVIDEVKIADMCNDLERSFRQVAREKALGFDIETDNNLIASIHTDGRRVQQILKNLLSNAFKFTEKGSVNMKISMVSAKTTRFKQNRLRQSPSVVAFAVTDTGIGIPKDKQRLIFESFQQADGTISRKYGGTGLGLSISRELAEALGGEIAVQSELGKGSTFTLYLPATPFPQDKGSASPFKELVQDVPRSGLKVRSSIADDRYELAPDDRLILIVEDDPSFAQILLTLTRKHNYKGIVANSGEAALRLAEEYQPDAITLDIQIPELDGWTVLDRLKHNQTTRHIPVHIISVADDVQRGLQMGAVAHLRKPVAVEELNQTFNQVQSFLEVPLKRVLMVVNPADNFVNLLESSEEMDVVLVESGRDALSELYFRTIDCLVLSLDLPDMTSFELIEQMQRDMGSWKFPIILYAEKELIETQRDEFERLTKLITIKNIKSREHLLHEVTLFLHQVKSELPVEKQEILGNLNRESFSLEGKTILIIDDDVRNIFAITSILERYKMIVSYALDGRSGIEKLRTNDKIDLVLMDIMMPNMDGYEAIRNIRQMPEYQSLPIIALTAKAMPEDRENSIQAGASDYITKPVEVDNLLSLLRVHL